MHLPVAVNLPTSAVVDADLPAQIRGLLARHGVPPGLLEVEITEEALLQDRMRARTVLAALRADGVRVSIDDYGSGYSSLAYLRDLFGRHPELQASEEALYRVDFGAGTSSSADDKEVSLIENAPATEAPEEPTEAPEERTMIPFGPFLALGALEFLFFGERLLDAYFGLFD